MLLDYGDLVVHVFLEEQRAVLRAGAALGGRARRDGRDFSARDRGRRRRSPSLRLLRDFPALADEPARGRARRRHRGAGADPRRAGERPLDPRPRPPRRQPARRRPAVEVDPGAIPSTALRERALRLPRRRLHRRRPGERRAGGPGRGRDAASSTTSRSCPSPRSRSCCGWWPSGAMPPWAARRSRPTSASSPSARRTSRGGSPARPSAPTSSTAWRSSPSASRRCASGGPICRRSSTTSWPISASASASASRRCRRAPAPGCWSTPGRATCGSSATPSSAASSWPRPARPIDPPPPEGALEARPRTLLEVEKEQIRNALAYTRGHQGRAAELLGDQPQGAVGEAAAVRDPLAQAIASGREPDGGCPARRCSQPGLPARHLLQQIRDVEPAARPARRAPGGAAPWRECGGGLRPLEIEELVEGGGDLDQALEEVPGLRRGRAPDLLPGLVGGEEPPRLKRSIPCRKQPLRAPPADRSGCRTVPGRPTNPASGLLLRLGQRVQQIRGQAQARVDLLAQLAQAAQLDLGHLAEGLDDRRIELLAGHPLELVDGHLVRCGPAGRGGRR